MGVEMRRFAGRRTWPLRTSSPRQPSRAGGGDAEPVGPRVAPQNEIAAVCLHPAQLIRVDEAARHPRQVARDADEGAGVRFDGTARRARKRRSRWVVEHTAPALRARAGRGDGDFIEQARVGGAGGWGECGAKRGGNEREEKDAHGVKPRRDWMKHRLRRRVGLRIDTHQSSGRLRVHETKPQQAFEEARRLYTETGVSLCTAVPNGER